MKWLIIFLLSSLVFISPSPVDAIECGDPIPEGNIELLLEYQGKCETKIEALQQEQGTLNAAISTLNSKISLAQGQIAQIEAQINALEKEISILSTLLTDLNFSLDDLSATYVARVRESYKQRNLSSIHLLFSSKSFGEFLEKARYLSVVKARDHLILVELEKARVDYDNQKQLKEEKQAEVETLMAGLERQKRVLDLQKAEKNQILIETQNSEKKYQDLVKKAREELAAIAAIIAGRGDEERIRDVSTGEKIASILTAGPNLYACSTAPHLHFEVGKNGIHQNPFEKLINTNLIWDNADPPQNGSDSWPWPLHDPIRVTQGYGVTSYSSRYANNIHTGIDIVSTILDIKAVQEGALYRGGFPCGGGTLQYVRLDHKNDEYDTYYLHVNYF